MEDMDGPSSIQIPSAYVEEATEKQTTNLPYIDKDAPLESIASALKDVKFIVKNLTRLVRSAHAKSPTSKD